MSTLTRFLTPALCAILLKHTHGESAFFRALNRSFKRLTNFYVGMVSTTIRHKIIGAIVFVGIVGFVLIVGGILLGLQYVAKNGIGGVKPRAPGCDV